jgi:hypothetical protein
MLRYGIDRYSVFRPVMPCLSMKIRRRLVNRMASRTSLKAASTTSPSKRSLA